jgi:hypothetical protein
MIKSHKSITREIDIYDMGLLGPVIRQADARLKYINCVFLNGSLQEAREREPDDIDLIAAICSAKNLDEETLRMLSLFGQVREALLAVKDNIPEKVLQSWREKAMMTKLNPGSIDYLASMSLKEITKEENKMEIVKEIEESTLIGKKRQHGEEKREVAIQTQDMGIDNIQQQMQGLEITAKQQTQVVIKQEEILLSSDEEKEKRKTGKKHKTNSKKQKEKQIEQDRMEIYQEPQVIAEASTSRQKSQSEDLIITGIPLSQSMWAPSRRPCSNVGEYKTKISAYNVLGDDKEQRIKMIEGILAGNKHLKEVKETFTNYNKWVEVTFDCETGRKEAMDKIEKKNREWFRMIAIDSQQPKQKDNTTHKGPTTARPKKTEKRKKQKEIEEEYRKFVPSESEGEESSTEEEENNNNNNSIYITIWDLPKEINQLEVQHACKKLGKLEEIQIKRSFSKALAVVKLQKKFSKTVPWVIPIGDEKLARVTEGIEDYKKRDSQSNVIAKLRGIPRGASEVLLLNNLRNRRAKSVYIP